MFSPIPRHCHIRWYLIFYRTLFIIPLTLPVYVRANAPRCMTKTQHVTSNTITEASSFGCSFALAVYRIYIVCVLFAKNHDFQTQFIFSAHKIKYYIKLQIKNKRIIIIPYLALAWHALPSVWFDIAPFTHSLTHSAAWFSNKKTADIIRCIFKSTLIGIQCFDFSVCMHQIRSVQLINSYLRCISIKFHSLAATVLMPTKRSNHQIQNNSIENEVHSLLLSYL